MPDERIGIATHRSGIDHQQIDVAGDRLSAPGIRAKEHHADEWQYCAERPRPHAAAPGVPHVQVDRRPSQNRTIFAAYSTSLSAR